MAEALHCNRTTKCNCRKHEGVYRKTLSSVKDGRPYPIMFCPVCDVAEPPKEERGKAS